jgi:hypothetical protein
MRLSFQCDDTARLVQLRRVLYGVNQRLDCEDLNDLELSVEVDRKFDEMVLNMRAHVWGQDSQPVRSVTYPADWWQAFKERWFPIWAQKRWPPRYTRIDVSAAVIYPDLKIALPDRRHTLDIHIAEFDWGNDA